MEKEIISYSEIEKLIEKLMAKCPSIQGIRIGIPGVVTKSNIIDFCDIEDLASCPLAELLTNKFGKSVVIENDMNLTAYDFYETGKYEKIPL
jgi:Transcriptional regulator/sugar kinase